MNKFIYKLNQNEKTILTDLIIKEYCPIQDNYNNKLLINKLSLNDSKLFFETDLVKVIHIDNTKLHIELPQSHIELFNYLDQQCLILLENLINEETELDTWDINWDSQNIQYKPILDIDSNILKINIGINSTIKINSKQVNFENIKIDDTIRIVLGLDYISLLVDSMIARTKLYCYFIEIHRPLQYKSEPREIINTWEFSSKVKSENIFIKTKIDEIDNIDVKTEIPNNKNELELNTCINQLLSNSEINLDFNNDNNLNEEIISNLEINNNNNLNENYLNKNISNEDNTNNLEINNIILKINDIPCNKKIPIKKEFNNKVTKKSEIKKSVTDKSKNKKILIDINQDVNQDNKQVNNIKENKILLQPKKLSKKKSILVEINKDEINVVNKIVN